MRNEVVCFVDIGGIVDHNCLNYERKFKQWLHYLFKINRNNSKIKLLIFSVFTDFKIVIFSVYTELKLFIFSVFTDF